MGAFTDGNSPGDMAAKEKATGTENKQGFKTDVNGLEADDMVKQGKDEFPVFDVDQKDFYQNMEGGRRRMRFASGSKAQKYMQNTKYKRAFYVRHTDNNGKKYIRRVK